MVFGRTLVFIFLLSSHFIASLQAPFSFGLYLASAILEIVLRVGFFVPKNGFLAFTSLQLLSHGVR